ncbi:uncharacterized protein HaLaN_27741 [Haematococcus lacustris]|uniref:Uncharacterized protein n=1 Tax=Haematococcus lacustris TaxID=44745 RepID=A0A6A0A9P8_HAELA|nr:uncharacterized protein HaLaN_27741 [Haematococcus lacustris]
MAGLFDSLVVARTVEGQRGTAGVWPSGRKITGVILHSMAEFHVKHTALAAMVNVTFVGYSANNGQFQGALEACGKCKTFQGGATTFTKQLLFLQPGKPLLSTWSWGHQGVFQDLDGSLVNAANLPSDLVAAAGFPLGVPNTTWHSAVDSTLFDPQECVYVSNAVTSNRGAFCSANVTFRRVMLNNHFPPAIHFLPLRVTTNAGRGAFNSSLMSSNYNGGLMMNVGAMH